MQKHGICDGVSTNIAKVFNQFSSLNSIQFLKYYLLIKCNVQIWKQNS